MRTSIPALTLALLLASSAASAQTYHWWNQPYVPRPPANPSAKKLPLISVKGNQFVDPQGNAVLFRGVAVADPDKLASQGHWNKELFVQVKQMGARVVRIPVHPIAWRERTPKETLRLLDQAVEWCTELELYIDLDWHSIGNLKAGLFQDPNYDTSIEETNNFWRTAAEHFAGNNTVAFFELFNEPTLFSGRLGRMSWGEWKKINEDLIALIRAYDQEKIPLVAGLDWAYDLTPLHIEPIAAERIAYTVHPYAHKRSQPWEPKWEEDFGFAAANYPVVATEFGFNAGERGTGEKNEYGKAIVKYLEGKRISWICWLFDPDWGPSLLRSWDGYALSESGEFFKGAMQGLAAEDRFARLDGYKVHYQSYGSGKRAVVFLSGWGCDTTLWRNQAPALADKWRVLLVDLPGHGRSDAPEIRYTLALFTRAVAAVLDDAGVEKAAVAGHSMGGMVAYQFAVEHPERTLALIWVDGAFAAPIQIDQQMANFKRHAQEFRGPDYKAKVSEFIDQLFVPETPAAVREEVRRSILATPQHVLASCQEELANPATFEHSVLDIPAFALFSSFWKPERATDIFKKYLPRLEYEVMTGVGHYPMLEKPAETNAFLARVLARL